MLLRPKPGHRRHHSAVRRHFVLLLAGFVLLAGRGGVLAQSAVERLPPVYSPDELMPNSRVELATAIIDPTSPTEYQIPDQPSQIGPIYEEVPFEEDLTQAGPSLPPGAKPGMLQRTIFRTSYLPNGGADGLGMTDVTGQLILAFPLYFMESPLIVSPSFTTHFLEGPTITDLPPRLYDASLEFRWMKQITPRFGADLSIAPSIYSDFENDSSDAYRLTGRAIGAWQWTPATQVVFGAAYLGRQDVPVLPIGGLIFQQDPDTTWELVFPRPRLLHRYFKCGDIENFWYIAGEFGGNSYAILRANGAEDQVTYSDWRVLVGFERKVLYGLTSRLEAGYVFGREIEYESGTPGFDPTSTALVRAELSY